jgi:hypothetical protein
MDQILETVGMNLAMMAQTGLGLTRLSEIGSWRARRPAQAKSGQQLHLSRLYEPRMR